MEGFNHLPKVGRLIMLTIVSEPDYLCCRSHALRHLTFSPNLWLCIKDSTSKKRDLLVHVNAYESYSRKGGLIFETWKKRF